MVVASVGAYRWLTGEYPWDTFERDLKQYLSKRKKGRVGDVIPEHKKALIKP
ncbi:MAG: hypothetical protein ACYTEQ_24850 [Planctomycetota bacterium]|jgi:hypothetical protein